MTSGLPFTQNLVVYKTQASAFTVKIAFDRGPSHLVDNCIDAFSQVYWYKYPRWPYCTFSARNTALLQQSGKLL